MTSLICPVDFSQTSINAARLAVIISRLTGSKLEFTHVSNDPEAQTSERIRTEIEKLGYRFGGQPTDDFAVTVLKSHLAEYINGKPEEEGLGLVIMGTDGISNITEFYQGTHTENIAGKSDVPVLVVPSTFSGSEFKKILFLTDYEDTAYIDIEALLFFCSMFKSDLEVVHFSNEENEISQKAYQLFVDVISEYSGSISNLKFTRIVNPDKETALLAHAIESEADLIVVHKGNFETNDGSKTDLLTRMAAIPLLILK